MRTQVFYFEYKTRISQQIIYRTSEKTVQQPFCSREESLTCIRVTDKNIQAH